ncbi:MAG: sulfite exporter TauE/SafE family protein [Clostridia bacterium]|nr:sulfite exporter TauE/SafE family protein [Clostridia bacterium]
MEYVWYVIAALGAGIGTGLAGLSAATVMVPVLIMLCPSFAGETGAYQATAIALASDILGSAVSARTYARNWNIDLKRGRGTEYTKHTGFFFLRLSGLMFFNSSGDVFTRETLTAFH